MGQASQSESESLLGDQGAETPAAGMETPGEGSAEGSMRGEDTGEQQAIQGKEEGLGTGLSGMPAPEPAAVNLRGEPWVDYVPEFTHILATNVEDSLSEHLGNMNEYLADKEKHRLSYHNQKIHIAYQSLWVRDGNRIFRAMVKLKNRRARYRREEGKT